MLKKKYFEFFNICYTYENKRDPNYPLLSSIIIFSSILTLIMIFFLILYDAVFTFNLSNILGPFIFICWFGLMFVNYLVFKKCLENGKLIEYDYDKIKGKYNMFIGMGLLLLFFTIILIINF